MATSKPRSVCLVFKVYRAASLAAARRRDRSTTPILDQVFGLDGHGQPIRLRRRGISARDGGEHMYPSLTADRSPAFL
jgi:hypothetical protein